MKQIRDLAVVLALVPVIKDGEVLWDVSMTQMNGSSTDGLFLGEAVPGMVKGLIDITEASESIKRRLLDDGR